MRRILFLLALLVGIGTCLFSMDGKSKQQTVYAKSIANMAKPDLCFSDVAAAVNGSSAPVLGARLPSTKTCSQRCSKTCSVSCTTTRGCSVRCKAQTEGCSSTKDNATDQKKDVQQTPSSKDNKTNLVYVTKSGKKYHQPGCSYLRGGGTSMKLSDAQSKGYTPCSKCSK